MAIFRKQVQRLANVDDYLNDQPRPVPREDARVVAAPKEFQDS